MIPQVTRKTRNEPLVRVCAQLNLASHSDALVIPGVIRQSAELRHDFVRAVVSCSFTVIALQGISVALGGWFDVGLGLRLPTDRKGA